MKYKLPITTITITATLVLLYFVLSGGRAYITPFTIMYPLGVSSNNMIGALTYTFTHIGIKHLIGNLIALATFGLLLERRIDSWHVAGVFLVSGVFGGAAYALIHPNVWVVGASTAIAGLLAASTVIEPKKTVIAFALVMFLVPNVVFPASDAALDSLERFRANEAKMAQKRAEKLESQIRTGNYTNETIRQKQIEEKKLHLALESKQSLESGRNTEAATPVSPEIHFLGAFFALLFLWIFDRDIVNKRWRKLIAVIKS